MSTMIDETNVSIDAIKKILEDAYIDVETSDVTLVAKMTYRTLIFVSPTKNRLDLYIAFNAKRDIHDSRMFRYMNGVNLSLSSVKASMDGDRDVRFECTHFIGGGVSGKNIVKALRNFNEAVSAAVVQEGHAEVFA